jgi:hypothetical protein
MPSNENAPRALSAPDLLRWLDQVAEDRSLAPITSRLAAKLALRVASGEASVVLRNEDAAAILKVTHNTAHRAIVTLRARGHIASSARSGRALAYRPILRGEG